MTEVQCATTWGGHSGKCPTCGVSVLITGEPCVVKCPCGTEWKATWWRVGDPIIKISNAT